MSKTGMTILLTTILFVTSGVKANAQVGINFPIAEIHHSSTCTSIQNYLLAQNGTCENKKLSQTESVTKASENDNKGTKPVTFSYSTEATYYVEPTPTPSITPTDTSRGSVAPIVPSQVEQTPLDLKQAESLNLDSNLIFDLINAHRASIGKTAFVKDDKLCSLAQTRSTELHDELFVNHNLHSGLYNRNLPYWITENAKWGSNEAGTVDWWLHSPIHRRAIEGDYIYSCGACNGTQCSQLFTSHTPKKNN